jgi:hypothetical protein
MGRVMVDYGTAGPLFHYTMAVFLLLSCSLWFICIRADEMALARSSDVAARIVAASARVDTGNYAEYAAQCWREAEPIDLEGRKALLIDDDLGLDANIRTGAAHRMGMSLLQAIKRS